LGRRPSAGVTPVVRAEVAVADPRPADLDRGNGADMLDQLEVAPWLLTEQLVDINDTVRVVAQNPLHVKS
jgi:hypothetical protein